MKRVLLAVSAAALLSLLGLAPAFAQDPPETPGTGEITDQRWAGSQFKDEDLREQAAGIREATTVTIKGVFTHEARDIRTVTAAATDPAIEGCDAPSAGDVALNPSTNARTREFSFEVTSQCNLTFDIVVHARTTDDLLGSERSPNLTATLSFNVAPTPVTDIIATVEDTETKDVNVSWTLPDDAEPDTTYFLERAGPDAGDEPEWTTIAPAEPEAPDGEETEAAEPLESPITDTVTDDGVYLYRVVAERPEASSADSEEPMSLVVAGTEDDVRVGKPPPTTTSPTMTQPPSAGSVPRITTAPTRSRGSTRTNVTPAQPSPPTTIDTGFEQTLDYGDREPGELAAEGQSIITTSDDSVVGPGAAAASALVLVGWAGHVVYFRRLSAQF